MIIRKVHTSLKPVSSAVFVALSMLAHSTLLNAQSAEAPDDDEEEKNVIETILVTAEKRVSSLQETPLAISAFGANQLDERGISGAEDLQYYVPGLSFGKTVTRTSQVTIRGIGSENINPGGDPGVAVHVDGAYQQFTGYIAQDFFDIARVEVLRGPQGTLYGRNATGGSINIVTMKPEEDFEGKLKLGIGNFNQQKLQGFVTGTLVDDTLFGRISIDTEKRDGYTKNLFNGDDIDNKDYYAVRGQLQYEPVEDLSINLSVYTYRDDSTGVPLSSISPNPTGPLFTGINFSEPPDPVTGPGLVFSNFYVTNNAVPNVTLDDRREVRHNTATVGEENTDGAILTINKDFDKFSIKSTSAYNDSDYINTSDTDSSAEVNAFQSTSGSYKTFSQEIQISSVSEGPLEWTAGIYYYKEESEFDLSITLGDTVDLPTPFVGVPVTFVADVGIDAKSLAIFGQAKYNFTDNFSMTGGLRATKDEKELSESVLALAFGIADFATFGPATANLEDDWNETNGKIGAEYTGIDDVLLYGSISTGFKAGGFNAAGLQSSYEPETVTAYEAGIKSYIADGSVRLNAATFFYDYDDLQVFQIESVQAFITNAASAESFGAEVEVLALLTADLEVDASISYLDATFKEFESFDPVDAAAGLQDLSGNSLPRSPEFTLNLGLQNTWELDGGSYLRARINYAWSDEQYFRAFNLQRDREDSFSRTDISLLWTSADDEWTVEAFIKNIEDDDVVSNIVVAAATLGSTALASFNPPRTYGISVSKRFE